MVLIGGGQVIQRGPRHRQSDGESMGMWNQDEEEGVDDGLQTMEGD